MPRSTLALSVLALLTAFGGVATAQPGAATAPTTDGQGGYRASQVIGTTVSIAGNRGIGTVEDIVFDTTGQIDYLIVSNQNRMVAVPWRAARYDSGRRTAVLNITQEQFQSVPTFTAQKYPNFYNPTYRTDIYKYYGLTPAQERQIERQNDRLNDRR